MRLDVPDLVRHRARVLGAEGRRWLDELPGVVRGLAERWQLQLDGAFTGGTSALVLAATGPDGTPCVLKVAMPAEDAEDVVSFEHSLTAHQLADGRGCVALLAHDTGARALLLERLGPDLHELGLPVDAVIEEVVRTLRSFWRAVPADCGLPTGPDKARWLAELIARTWSALDRPCERAIVDRAVDLCAERAGAFDDDRAVLVHGDAHGWNTLRAGHGTSKLVDPEGLRSDPAHDLAVVMREYNGPLLAGDTARLVRARAELVATWCDVDPDAVWQWGYIERVANGLLTWRDFGRDEALPFLEVARRAT